MVGHDIIVIGASAGGIEPLLHLVSALPPDLPAAILVVLHIPAEIHSRCHLFCGRPALFPRFIPLTNNQLCPVRFMSRPRPSSLA